MTNYHHVRVQRPPLPGVAVGDVVWVPVFASDETGGNPFWMRITDCDPPADGKQLVHGILIINHRASITHPEVQRKIQLTLPLNRVHRRVFEPVDPSSVRGRAKVNGTGELPRREAR